MFKKGDKIIITSIHKNITYVTFTVGKIYTIGGKYFRENAPEHFAVICDDTGRENGTWTIWYGVELAEPYLQRQEAKKLLGLK